MTTEEAIEREFSHRSILATIARAVADCRGESTDTMAPLNDDIDLEAVQDVVGSNSDAVVQFPVRETYVTVTADGVIVKPRHSSDIP